MLIICTHNDNRNNRKHNHNNDNNIHNMTTTTTTTTTATATATTTTTTTNYIKTNNNKCRHCARLRKVLYEPKPDARKSDEVLNLNRDYKRRGTLF